MDNKLQLLTIKNIMFEVPQPTAKAKMAGKESKEKFIKYEDVAINIELITAITPGDKMEIEGTIVSTSFIVMMDDSYYRVPESFNMFVDRLMHSGPKE